MKAKLHALAILFVATLLISACNEPPLYGKNAREFLRQKGESLALAKTLSQYREVSAIDATRLANYENAAVLHLVAANPGTSITIIKRLSKRSEIDIQTGVAVNPSAPLPILQSLRTPGKYTTVNNALVRNPAWSQKTLTRMHANGEGGEASFAMNPNCPLTLMRSISKQGSEIARAWLARNPNLPDDIMRVLKKDSSEMVRNYLETNPKFGRANATS